MRLLLRATSHSGIGLRDRLIAASPDTPGRERWQWDLRILASPPDAVADGHRVESLELRRSNESTMFLAVTVDAGVVAPGLTTLDLSEPVSLERSTGELLALVVGRGVALVENRHVLGELDTVVLAGDDPTNVRVEQISEEPVSMAVVRLRPVGTGSLAWVP